MEHSVVIIGGGAAGMLAATGAARVGAPVVLLEKNEVLGRKMSLTGNGRCNLTNDTDVEGLVENIPGNGRFLYAAFHAFSSEDTRQLFNGLGLSTHVEPGGRVFPESGKSRDVIETLERHLKQLNVQIELNQNVVGLIVKENVIAGVKTKEQTWTASAVILCTGGASYPATGSTGDGSRWVRELGHTVEPVFPSLVSLETEEAWVRQVQGLALEDVVITAHGKNKILGRQTGDLLFTHFGISGPAILNLSRAVSLYLNRLGGPVRLELDLKAGQTVGQLEENIQEALTRLSRRELKNVLGEFLPQRLIPVFLDLLKISPELPSHQVTREQRKQMTGFLKSWSLTVTDTRPLKEAMVTAGGVSVKEVNPKTMESKIIPGLYFAGEVLDVDGFTGGFNLQAAFSTGYLAGTAAAQKPRNNIAS
ncbi:MAG: BaiN/RdsA family NAD(P)/FAD-dependent oxidoreductase [Bacillota bacterium]